MLLSMFWNLKEIEGKQDSTNVGVMKLCNFAFSLENQNTSTLEGIQESPSSSSKPALELLPVTPSLREKSPVSQVINFSSSSVDSSNTSTAEDKSNGSTSGLFGRRLPGINAPFLSRTHSATDAVLWHTRSSSRPS